MGKCSSTLETSLESNDCNLLYDLSLEELSEARLESSTLIGATQAETPGWVALIRAADWERIGARRTFEALAQQPATLALPFVAGGEARLST